MPLKRRSDYNMEEPRPFDQVATDLMDDAADKVKWARKQANKMLSRADEIEEQAAITASKFREAAASLIIEASTWADDVADILQAEYPMNSSLEDDDE